METWDAYGQENFKLRVLLFCTINDYPALGNLSGQTIKGKKACSDCKEHTRSRWLKKSRKMVYMGHRRWLPLRHAFRRKKKIFNGKRELLPASKDLSEDDLVLGDFSFFFFPNHNEQHQVMTAPTWTSIQLASTSVR